MLRARMALDSSYLGEIEFGLRQIMTASQQLEANYELPKYLEANF
jgi:hypothetical protein